MARSMADVKVKESNVFKQGRSGCGIEQIKKHNFSGKQGNKGKPLGGKKK